MKPDLMRHAIDHNDVELLRSVYQERRFNKSKINLVYIASSLGHLDILKFLHEKNVPMDINVAIFGAKLGRHDMLEFAHQIGLVWNRQTCKK